ncbi:MAG: DUF1402 family protein [Rhizobiaceae bacterium]|nr:DUF1402 family protein [Rhizobiaceae bacterium]MCV0404677.1 DUF1402 family protein [Rhizobiaceae bacterium]
MTMRLWLLAGMTIAMLAAGAVQATTVVPPGNRHAEQPPIPGGSSSRTAALKTTFEAKYRKVHRLLSTDGALMSKIDAVARDYGIEPIHMIGAIVGEHTYNVDAYDRLQTYYVKAVSYLQSAFTFSHGGENVVDFVARPEFEACDEASGSYEVWSCREAVWNRTFRGRSVDGRVYPDDRFSAVFFQPLYAGQTFGIGQVNPLTALKMSDLVSKTSGLPRLDPSRPQGVYQTIMDPDLTLPYVAATIRKSIDAYRDIAGFDISGNPGLTATLYNVGNPETRARALKAENERRLLTGEPAKLPEENYYGWLVNEKLAELKALF